MEEDIREPEAPKWWARFAWLWAPNSVGSAWFAIVSGVALVAAALWVDTAYSGFAGGDRTDGAVTRIFGLLLIYGVVRVVQGSLFLREPGGGSQEPPVATRQRKPSTWPRSVQWALIVAVWAAVWLGPSVLGTILNIALGIYILVWGPQWMRLWLATILGCVLLTIGIALGIAVLIE